MQLIDRYAKITVEWEDDNKKHTYVANKAKARIDTEYEYEFLDTGFEPRKRYRDLKTVTLSAEILPDDDDMFGTITTREKTMGEIARELLERKKAAAEEELERFASKVRVATHVLETENERLDFWKERLAKIEEELVENGG